MNPPEKDNYARFGAIIDNVVTKQSALLNLNVQPWATVITGVPRLDLNGYAGEIPRVLLTLPHVFVWSWGFSVGGR